jgi:hypothetical protein
MHARIATTANHALPGAQFAINQYLVSPSDHLLSSTPADSPDGDDFDGNSAWLPAGAVAEQSLKASSRRRPLEPGID